MDRPALENIAAYLRFLILEMTHRVGSGHPTTSFSAVDLATVLYFKYLRFDLSHPENEANDRVIFSKGHASALFYALYHVAGKVSKEELLTYREKGSRLEGHPTVRFPFTEAATGSLGQGLSVGAGISWAIRARVSVGGTHDGNRPGDIHIGRSDHAELPFLLPRVYVLLGDGELAEGSVWEAAAWAAHQKLNHLIAIVDVNRFGQSGETMHGADINVYRDRFESFGWGAIVIDGHDFGQIDAAFEKALVYKGGPVAILARTVKGKGVAEWEDKDGWHNKMLPKDVYEKALAKFGKTGPVHAEIKKPEIHVVTGFSKNGTTRVNSRYPAISEYDREIAVATKQAFANALVRLSATDPRIAVLDADVANSLHTDLFKNAYPARFLEMYIAEQNMAGVAVGLARQGFLPVMATFSAFLTRCHDQIRMMPLSNVSVVIDGSYAGVSVGRDGPSQMGLEDLSMFRAVPGSVVLYPADAYAAERLCEVAVAHAGVAYVRTTREPTPVLYKAKDAFPVGGSKVWRMLAPGRKPQAAQVTIVACGITLHEALKAQKTLSEEKILADVVDAYSVKPIDAQTIRKLIGESGALVVVEDHVPEGGLGEAVLSAVVDMKIGKFKHLAVRAVPSSASAEELLRASQIDAEAISGAVRTLMGG